MQLGMGSLSALVIRQLKGLLAVYYLAGYTTFVAAALKSAAEWLANAVVKNAVLAQNQKAWIKAQLLNIHWPFYLSTYFSLGSAACPRNLAKQQNLFTDYKKYKPPNIKQIHFP